MKYCTRCGHSNPDDANFCASCGAPQEVGSTAARSAGDTTTGSLRIDDPEPANEVDVEVAGVVDELDPGTALLVVIRGPNQGARYLLDRDVTTVGRHPSSDIFLDDITVSRRHAEFRLAEGSLWVHDAGSLNGTYVDGRRADDQQLATGDEVQVGKFKLVVMMSGPTDPAAA